MSPPTTEPPATTKAWRTPSAVITFAVVAVLVLAADLGFKAWAFDYVPKYDAVVVVPSVLNLHLTRNTGAVFGFGKGAKWFFIVMSVAAAGIIVRIFARSPAASRVLHMALALILAGALGNLYDRARFGSVRDMLNLFPGVKLPFGWAWSQGPPPVDDVYPWIFNIADAALVVGVGTLMVLLWFADKHSRNAQANPS